MEKSFNSIREAAESGAKIICLPEFFSSLYFCQTCEAAPFDLAVEQNSDFIRKYRDLAKELEIVLVISYFEKRAEGIYHNSAIILDADGSVAGHYRKMHLPNDPQFYEKYYFSPGDTGFNAFQTRYGKIGVLICWDQWFPEAARLTALAGAEIIFYPTSIAWHSEDIEAGISESQRESWRTIQKSHAIANSCYIATANRCGTETSPNKGDSPLEFWGSSFVSDPSGTSIAEAGTEEETLIADIDFDQIAAVRRMWNFFRDRRVDAYSNLYTRFNEEKPD